VREGEARYRQLVDMFPGPSWCPVGKCVFANPTATPLSGATSLREMLVLNVLDLTFAELAPGVFMRISPNVMSQIYLAYMTWLIPSPLMGEGRG
jgi:hypothetical protein